VRTDPPDRLAALDTLRGVAVLGILVANLPGFALPRAAYFSPLAWGGTGAADVAVWAATFMLVEGKLRALFAMLFGASMLLVVQRAEAAGEDAVAMHLRRMFWLFAIGCAHLYLLWWGDILNQYALVGTVALAFAWAPTRVLLPAGTAALLLGVLDGAELALAAVAAAPRATAAQAADWNALAGVFGVPPRAVLLEEIAHLRGGWGQAVAWRWDTLGSPLRAAWHEGAETLGYMLLGMAGLRVGFLTGGWGRRSYRRIALAVLAVTLPLHAAVAWWTWRSGFDLRAVTLASAVLAPALRPFTVAGYVALVLLPTRAPAALVAAGRMALSCYLASSLAMTALFDGWGFAQFGRWPRATPYLLVPVAWAAMLMGARWWLARFTLGPAEWLWRSLARGEMLRTRRI
jgi:uncharacterized protein